MFLAIFCIHPVGAGFAWFLLLSTHFDQMQRRSTKTSLTNKKYYFVGGSSKDAGEQSSTHSNKEETSSCQQTTANYSKYSNQNWCQTGSGNDGDDPNEPNENPKRKPDDKNVIEDEDNEEEETEDNSEPDDEEIEFNVLGKTSKITITSPSNIPNYPEQTYHVKTSKSTTRNSTGCFIAEQNEDRFSWIETKQAETARKKKRLKSHEDVIGHKILKELRCRHPHCTGRKYIGFPTKRIAKKQIIYVRSIKWTKHSCDTGECSLITMHNVFNFNFSIAEQSGPEVEAGPEVEHHVEPEAEPEVEHHVEPEPGTFG